MAIEFFGNVDKNKNGEISSDMPAWFFDVHLEYLEEEVAKKKRRIDRGEIPPDNALMVRQEIVNQEDRIKEIKSSMPKLKGGQKDMIYKQYCILQNEIATSMPTRRDNVEGYTNPREELKRMKTQHIPVNQELAKACNVKVVKGKVSGDDASRMYKMMGRILGENENVEKIRREGRSESQRSMEDFTKHILETKLNGREGIKEKA